MSGKQRTYNCGVFVTLTEVEVREILIGKHGGE